MLLGKWVIFMNIPKGSTGDSTGVGINYFLPVTCRILCVPRI